jgi:hypothetical protein
MRTSVYDSAPYVLLARTGMVITRPPNVSAARASLRALADATPPPVSEVCSLGDITARCGRVFITYRHSYGACFGWRDLGAFLALRFLSQRNFKNYLTHCLAGNTDANVVIYVAMRIVIVSLQLTLQFVVCLFLLFIRFNRSAATD